AAAHAIDIGAVVGLLRQRRLAEHAAQLGELRVVADSNDHVAVSHGKNLIRHDVRVSVADALRRHTGGEIVERLIGEHPDLRVEQRRVDEAAAFGLLALGKPGEDADDGIDPGKNVGDRHAGAGRLAIGRPGYIHDAAHALRHQVVAGARRIRSGLTEAGDRAIDEPRVHLGEALVVEAKFGETSDLEILDQNVRALGELAYDGLSLGAFEIDLYRALAAVGRMEIGGA